MLFLIVSLFVFKTVNAKDCTLPSKFEYGNLEPLIYDKYCRILNNTRIKINCNDGFKPYPFDIVTCQDVSNGKASCIKTCPSIKPPAIGVGVSCQYDGKETSCENPYSGTTVIYKCEKLYENRNENDRRVFVCLFGFWDFNPQYKCQPVCGKKFVQPNKLIVGGEDAKESEFVWNIALYYTKNLHRQICGGTIITPKISLSAAHCFSKYVTDRDAKSYVAGAGKTYRNNLDSRDNNDVTQYRTLSDIVLPEYFSFGADSRLDNDIAILIVEKPFTMTSYVLPACLDKNGLYNHDMLTKVNGTVVGWGWTEENKPSEHLKVLNVEYATRQKCKLQFNYKRYYYPYVQDKICAGLYNQGKSACKGDSGSGLVFPADDGRFYLRGIVSIAPKRRLEACDTNRYTLYTSVAYHLDVINQQIANYIDLSDYDRDSKKVKPYENGCIVPRIENGRISNRQRAYFPDSDDIALDVGSPVPNGTALFYDCASSYYKAGGLTIKCINGEWTDTTCTRSCGIYINQGQSTNYQCYHYNRPINCGGATDGTVMKITCKPGYIYNSDTFTPFGYCKHGQWSVSSSSYCRTPCGLDYGDGPKEIAPIDGPTTFEEFPWHVGIYLLSDYTYLCSGVYYHGNFIVTARSCVESYNASDIFVSIGGTYREIDVNRTERGATYDVSAIHHGSDLAKGKMLDISDTVSFVSLSSLITMVHQSLAGQTVRLRIPRIHPVCDGKAGFKFDVPGFFVSWEDPYSLDKYFDQLYKIQIVVREPKVCNVTISDGVCIEVVGKPICQRATGGAFVFKDHYERYNLVGLAVTTPPKGKECNVTHMVVEVLY